MIKYTWIQKLDYIFITRPMLFFPGWNTLLAGYLAGREDNRIIDLMRETSFPDSLWRSLPLEVMIAFMFAMGACFVLNQLSDVESDRQNKKLFLLGEGYLSRRVALRESILLIFLSLAISLSLNLAVLVFMMIFMLITGFLYNFQPFEFKNHPTMGLVMNMMMGWLAFGIGWVSVSPLHPDLLIASLPYLFLNTGLYLLTTLPDVGGDQSTGKRTPGVVFGLHRSSRLAVGLFGGAMLVSLILNDQFLLLITALTTYYFLRLAFKPRLTHAIRALKMTIFFFSLLVAVLFPLYLPLMIAVFLLTRYYYRVRFDFEYPNFRGE